jgi:hypothetical protein
VCYMQWWSNSRLLKRQVKRYLLFHLSLHTYLFEPTKPKPTNLLPLLSFTLTIKVLLLSPSVKSSDLFSKCLSLS